MSCRLVVVGVDGSAASLAALDLAVREARARGWPLRVVHAYEWPYLDLPSEPHGEPLRLAAERMLEAAAGQAARTDPQVPVTRSLVAGRPATVLITESKQAGLVVLGHRGSGGFAELLAGSIAVQTAAHGGCPVLVFRGTSDRSRPVLLGVDATPTSEHTVGFAFEEASLRGVPLTALHAWLPPLSPDAGDLLPWGYDTARVEARAEAEAARVLAESLAGWQEKFPDVEVRRRLVRGRTRPVLLEATSRAQLVVVGGRGHGGFAGLLLGSVSHAMLHHAQCPVAVVPATSVPPA